MNALRLFATLALGLACGALASRAYLPAQDAISPDRLDDAKLDAGGFAEAGEFAWRAFIAMNWPAAGRGAPDRGKTLADPGPRVWESFKSAAETFPVGPNGRRRRAAPFDAFDGPNPCGLANRTRTIAEFKPFAEFNQPSFSTRRARQSAGCAKRRVCALRSALQRARLRDLRRQRLERRLEPARRVAARAFPGRRHRGQGGVAAAECGRRAGRARALLRHPRGHCRRRRVARSAPPSLRRARLGAGRATYRHQDGVETTVGLDVVRACRQRAARRFGPVASPTPAKSARHMGSSTLRARRGCGRPSAPRRHDRSTATIRQNFIPPRCRSSAGTPSTPPSWRRTGRIGRKRASKIPSSHITCSSPRNGRRPAIRQALITTAPISPASRTRRPCPTRPRRRHRRTSSTRRWKAICRNPRRAAWPATKRRPTAAASTSSARSPARRP